MRLRVAILTVVWGGLLVIGAATAEEREATAVSCSVADVQAAVDSLPEGGVVHVPAGEAEATGTIRLPGGIRLIGAGAEKTKLFRGPASDMMRAETIIAADGGNGKPIQIAGLNLVGFLDPASAGWDDGISLRNAVGFRVDHCRLQRFGAAGVSVTGLSRGVVDHCLFVDNFKKAINNVGYGVVVMGTGQWREDLKPGTEDSVFIEDCEFIGSRHAVASNAGARYVFRHNRVHGNDNSQAVDCHGPGYGSAHGTQWIEVYDNVIEKPIGGSTAMCLRGGGGVVFGNTMRDYRAGIQVTLDFDEKLDWSRPYPISEQIQGMWVWNNTLNGEPVAPMVPARSANHIQLDRDYFTKPLPDYQPFAYPHPLASGGPFDGG
jgi:hypothetical protein